MSNITVIECNKQHSNTGESNASWINTFQAPIRINQGDVLQMKTAIHSDTFLTSSIAVLPLIKWRFLMREAHPRFDGNEASAPAGFACIPLKRQVLRNTFGSILNSVRPKAALW